MMNVISKYSKPTDETKNLQPCKICHRKPVLTFNGIIACRRCRTLYYRRWGKLSEDLKRNYANENTRNLKLTDYSKFLLKYFDMILDCKESMKNESSIIKKSYEPCEKNCSNCLSKKQKFFSLETFFEIFGLKIL